MREPKIRVESRTMLYLALALLLLLAPIYTMYTSEKSSAFALKFVTDYAKRNENSKVSIDFENDEYRVRTIDSMIPKEPGLRIKESYIICGFDLYPFKKELRSLIYEFMIEKAKDISIEKSEATYHLEAEFYSMGFLMLFLKSDDHEIIWTRLRKLGKQDYIYKHKNEALAFVRSFPDVSFTRYENTEDDDYLMERLNLVPEETIIDHKALFNFVIQSFKTGHLAQFKEAFLPWADNIKMYSHFLGIVSSKSFQFGLKEFELFHVSTITEMQPRINPTHTYVNDYSTSYCVVPFVDLIKQRRIPKIQLSLPIERVPLISKKGYVYSVSPLAYEHNQEYVLNNYGWSSEVMALNRGAILEDDALDRTYILLKLHKFKFPMEKYEICAQTNCLPNNFDKFYQDPNVGAMLLKLHFLKKRLNRNLLNFFRLYTLEVLKFKTENNFSERVLGLLKKDAYIDYDNEIKTMAELRQILLNYIYKNRTNYRIKDIVYVIQSMRNQFNALKNPSIATKVSYKKKMNLFVASKLKKEVFVSNIIFCLEGSKWQLKDQFERIKKFYLK